MLRPNLKTTFNTVASLYDEARPGYPDELVRDIWDLSEIDKSGRILEVGCGTGQASRLFAALGCEMTCLDIGQDLLEIARARLSNYKNVRLVRCPFEDWDSPSKFDLVISATAFGWVSPRVRFIRARDALKARGSLAIFSNQHVRKDEGFFAEVQEVYSKYYVVSDFPLNPCTPTTSEFPEPGTAAFADSIHRVYGWTANYSAEQYIKLIGTYSDHIALPEFNRTHLFDGIADLIDKNYGGSITKHYETALAFRRKKPD